MSGNNDTFVVRDRRPGFLRVYNDLYDKFGSTLGPYGLAVYVALCRYADQESECFPSYGTIAKGTGMSRRKVIYEIKRMEDLQLVDVQRNQHTSNVFTLLDTSALCAPLPGAQHAPPSAQRAPKQDPVKKITHRGSNKKEVVKNYRPAEYADVILG